MNFLLHVVDVFLHLDVHLATLISRTGLWTYAILSFTIFAETGLVFAPFLPGDSLIFAVGALAATGVLNIWGLWICLVIAAVIGDATNYAIGNKVGLKLFDLASGRFLKRSWLTKTQDFYDRYGNKTIFLARFMPILRTIAPFVAGIGNMPYSRFFAYNLSGGFAWVSLFLWGGYFFGNIGFVKEHFSVVVLVIIALSVLSGVLEFFRQRSSPKKLDADKTTAA